MSQVAQQLGVRYVVEGSIRRSADRVRVNAQLVDGNSGRHIWGERYDRQITDVFTVQEELVTQIASALAVKLSRIQGGAAGQRKVPEFRAYELYLKARDAYFSGDDSRLRESMDLYEQAASVDPSFARAYSGYAQVAVFIWRLRGVRLMNQALARASAETAARTALALDPTLAEAHSVLALLAVGEADYDNALKSAQRAVSLEPNSAEAHSALCVVLVYAGHPEAALAAIRTAVRLDPKPSLYIRTYLGLALFFNRRYEEAIAALEPIANTQSGGFDVPREILAMVYAELGRLDEARTHVARILEDLPLLNLQVHRARYQHHARPEDLERRIDALASAGMPHWPFGYEGDPRQQLRDDEIKLLAFGHTWSGINMNERGEPTKFIEQFDHDGTAVFATAHSMNRGTAFVQDDALCERLSGVAMSRTLCGPVYRNKTDSGRGGDYIYVNGASIRYFSVTE